MCEFRALRQADVELHKRSVHNGQRLVREELFDRFVDRLLRDG